MFSRSVCYSGVVFGITITLSSPAFLNARDISFPCSLVECSGTSTMR